MPSLRKLFKRSTRRDSPGPGNGTSQDACGKKEPSPDRGKDTEQTYSYQPLGEFQMRILVLTPSRVAASELSGEIRACAIAPELYHEEQTRYIALSYEWGADTAQTERMRVYDRDGRDLGWIGITRSLYTALRDLRDSTLLDDAVSWERAGVFADQVCINQGDEAEVELQVASMGRIYRQAAMVATYLGSSGSYELDKPGLALLQRIFNHCERHFDRLQQSWYAETNILEAQRLLKDLTYTIEPQHPGLSVVREMMWGAWMQRLWMIPENMLHRRTSFLRGSHEVDWRSVVVLHVLAELDLIKPGHLLKGPEGQKYSPIALNIWKVRMYSSEQLSLTRNMTAFAAGRCSDDRDKAYALLSISDDAVELQLTPEYAPQLSVHYVFSKVTETAAVYHNDLSVFETAEQFPNTTDQGWESWLPDWRVPSRDLTPFWDTHQVIASRPKPNFRFQAQKHQSEMACVINGAIYDQIRLVLSADPLPDLPAISRNDASSSAGFASMQKDVLTAQIWGFSDDKIATTLTASTFWSPESTIEEAGGPAAALQAFMSCARYQQPASQGIYPCPSDATARLGESFSRLALCARGRKLGITDDRGRLCLCNPDVRVGDLVVGISGASMPWILRPCGDALFKLIGLVYVDAYSAEALENERKVRFVII